MHTVSSLESSKWAVNSAGAPSRETTGADFAKLLEGLKSGTPETGGADGAQRGSSSSVSSLLNALSKKFPGVKFSEGSVGETPEDVREYFGSEEGDNVAIAPEAAEAAAGNSGLASMMENILSAFRESLGAAQPAEGEHMQRNVIFASVTVRFSVSRMDNQTGETLSMDEFTAAFEDFADRMQEMMEKMMETFLGGDSGRKANPFTSLLGGGTDASGMSGTETVSLSAGFSFQFSRSRSGPGDALLAELMEMLDSRRPAGRPESAPAEPPEEPEEEAEIPEEIEAEAVA